jgi:hypothetical protein
MKQDGNVYIFESLDEWISYTHSHESGMVSPGGFAMRAGVSRSTVNNWIYRDRVIRYYKCESRILGIKRGEYGCIPIDDLQKVKDRVNLPN